MQDPAIFQPMNMNPQFPDQQEQHLKCPRCDSNNTKFCYYNNYNLSQPRHFCKNCRRYWTKGGALRNIPVGGGTRKNTTKRPSKRSSSSSLAMQRSGSGQDPGKIYGSGSDLEVGGGSGVSFSSLLASNGGFGGVFEGMHSDGSGLKIEEMGGIGENLTPGLGLAMDRARARDPGMEEEVGGSNGSESFLGLQNGDSGCWSGGGNGWPDLAIYTPGSRFQ